MPPKQTHTLSIIIPVYNEEQTIQKVIQRVKATKLGANVKKEIIVIDDGSTDQSKHKIVTQKKLNQDNFKVHFSLINFGKGSAVRIGLKLASGNLAIIQDADLELNPNEYHKILAPILSGQFHAVYGSRFLKKNKNISLKTQLANWFLTSLVNILYGSKLTDMETAYKAFDIKVLKNIKLRALAFEFEPEITCKLLGQGIEIKEIPIKYKPRTANQGKKISFFDGIEAIYTILKCRFAQNS